MSRLCISLILLLFSFYSIAQSKKNNDTLYTILRMGFITRKQQIQAEVAPKFGFRYKILPAKGIDSFIIYPNLDSMRKLNAQTYKLIDSINGSNWRERFVKEVDRVYKNKISLSEFFENDSNFGKIRDSLTKDLDADNRYDFEIQQEVKLNKIFLLKYNFYTKNNDKVILNDSKTLRVNLRKRTVAILNTEK